MPSFEVSRNLLSNVGWEAEIERLNNMYPGVAVFTFDLLRPCLGLPISTSLPEAYSRLLEIANSSLRYGDNDDANDENRVAISQQIAYDLYLSVYGVGYHNPSSDQSLGTPKGADADAMLLDSQTETLPSSPLRQQSSPTPTRLSQRSNSEAADTDEDPAMTLLRAYTGTGKFVPNKQFELLEKWQLGAEPSDYVFDLDRSGEEVDAGRLRRAKQLAREHRKRRRAETLLQLPKSLEPELPATQPVPDTSFFSSQPHGRSSQRQLMHSDSLHTMSQPAFGAFGRRPNKKAKKRKGGF
jgi:hypothetical protein